MAQEACLTVRFPKWRMSAAAFLVRTIGPVIPAHWQGPLVNALAEWTCKGLRFTEHRAPDYTTPPRGE